MSSLLSKLKGKLDKDHGAQEPSTGTEITHSQSEHDLYPATQKQAPYTDPSLPLATNPPLYNDPGTAPPTMASSSLASTDRQAPIQQQPMAPNPANRPNAHTMQQAGARIGMGAGMGVSMLPGEGGMGGDMITGMVAGNFIGQQVGRVQNHAYWREQALNYQQGLPADGVVPVSAGSREAKRAARRQKRWNRRAARRAGAGHEGGASSGSSSGSSDK